MATLCKRDCGPFCLDCKFDGCYFCTPGKIPSQQKKCVQDPNADLSYFPKLPHGGDCTCADFWGPPWDVTRLLRKPQNYQTNLNYSLDSGKDIRFKEKWKNDVVVVKKCPMSLISCCGTRLL
jgi:hypothetical protein